MEYLADKDENRDCQRYKPTMKYLILFLLPAVLLACTNNANESSTSDTTGVAASELRPSELTAQEQKMKREQYYIWEVDADKKTITKNPQLQPEFFDVDTLIAGLNEMYPEITLEKKGLRNDTLYTAIKNAEYLTNRMGSLGSEQYIAQAVINLTSVEGIKFVRIDFTEGNHAAPDVWSREQFAAYQEREDLPVQ
jgi:hypothetical protein